MKRALGLGIVAGWLLTATPTRADEAARADSVLVRALNAEMARARNLSMAGAATTYHLAYRVAATEHVRVEAERGGLVQRTRDRSRRLAIDLRVGDRTLDNGNFEEFGPGAVDSMLTIDDDQAVLQHQIWRATDHAYKRAAESLEKKRAFLASRSGPRPPDLSIEKPARTIVDREAIGLDLDALAALAVELSAAMPYAAPVPFQGGVTIEAWSVGRTYVDSEGTFAYEPWSVVTVEVAASMLTDDGNDVIWFMNAAAPTPSQLPGRDRLVADVKAMMAQLDALRRAPTIEAYAGPVLFEGVAGAQLIRHVLAADLCGTPRPNGERFERMAGRLGFAMESRLGDRVGKAILPAGFDVVDDPTVSRLGTEPLLGGYAADDEGRPAQRVSLVRDGVLGGFLMSRTPRTGALQSNGHGRGLDDIRARPGNLHVSTRRGLPAKDLRRRLLAEARAAGEKFALVVRRFDDPAITGAFRDRADIFDIMMGGGTPSTVPAPLLVYRLWPDGREELVRGARFTDIPITALRDLVAAGREGQALGYLDSGGGMLGPMAMFLGGRRSLSAPVSVIAPSLLLRRLEVRPPGGRAQKPPVLTAPP